MFGAKVGAPGKPIRVRTVVLGALEYFAHGISGPLIPLKSRKSLARTEDVLYLLLGDRESRCDRLRRMPRRL